MRSAATSEFENFGQSEQTGFGDMDIDNDADDENLDNGRSNRKGKVCYVLTCHYNATKCLLSSIKPIACSKKT